MKAFILSLIFSVYGLALFAQKQSSVTGQLIDTASSNKMVMATVCILNARDSMLVSFTRTDQTGRFKIDQLPIGNFLILVTYTGHADYVAKFIMDSVDKQVNFKVINLPLKSRLLDEIIIKGESIAVKIKGDTTEFNAKNFKIRPGAKVEDLLKQFPGIQVDQNGRISAQGQTVNKVLLDGEEFFGDDPTLITQNIRADMVDKVQLYDKKSNQAAFTGIDDGQKTKTLNIKLKEDKKNGFFGKLEAGSGTDGSYQEQAFFNRFTSKQKFGVYGTLSNAGKIGLGWQDNSKIGGNGGLQVSDSGGLIFSGGSDELESFDGRYNGRGIPEAKTGGIHYDTKLKDGRSSINFNYKIGSLGVDGIANSIIQNNLPSQVFFSNTDNNYHKNLFRQKIDADYQIDLKNGSNLKIDLTGELKNSQNYNQGVSSSRRSNDTILNKNIRSSNADGRQKILNFNAFFTRKFKKTGRTFSLNFYQSIDENNSDGFLNSKTTYYNNFGLPDSLQTIDQHKINYIRSAVTNTNASYSELISKNFSLVGSYGLNFSNFNSNRQSFNQSASGKYDKIDSLYSNNYRLNQITNQFGVIFNYSGVKNQFNFGSKIADLSLNQTSLSENRNLKKNFVNWYPQLHFKHLITSNQYLNFDYSGTTNLPSIDQLQPLRLNTDPLNIIEGNPNLSPSFTNTYSLGYNASSSTNGFSMSVHGSFSQINNAIINNSVADSSGRTLYQFINLKGRKQTDYSFGGYFDKKIVKLNMNIGLLYNLHGNRFFSYANNTLNTTDSYTYSIQLRARKYVDNKYDFNFGLSPTYTVSRSSLQKDLNDNGRGFNGDGSIVIYLPFKFQINSDATYRFIAKTQSFNQDFERFLWSATANKKFLKDENLKLSLSVNDILNQNVGFSRAVSGNTIVQNSYNTIKRFFLVSISYDFNKTLGSKTQKL